MYVASITTKKYINYTALKVTSTLHMHICICTVATVHTCTVANYTQ